MRSIQEQLAAGDVEGGTRRFSEGVALGPGGWERVPEALGRAAMGNAQTFADLRDDFGWAWLDAGAVVRFTGPLTVTLGDASPQRLPRTAAAVARILGCRTRVIAGAGHAPHLTPPNDFAAHIMECVS